MKYKYCTTVFFFFFFFFGGGGNHTNGRVFKQEAFVYTVVSRYYNTAGIRKKYHYIQTIEISSISFYCFVIVGILIWYHNKQHFELSTIVITRDYCKSFTIYIFHITAAPSSFFPFLAPVACVEVLSNDTCNVLNTKKPF